MKRTIVLFLALALPALSQQVIRFSATTGDVSLVSAGTTATLQQPATNAGQVIIDQIVVYCSVACNLTQAANGTAATTTAGTVTPLLPTNLATTMPVNFFTASNVGTGTAQGGIIHIPAGSTVTICLSTSCGAAGDVRIGTGQGTAANYSAVVSSITGTANIIFIGRTSS